MLGFATAYEALGPEDEDVREMSRADAVELLDEDTPGVCLASP